MLPGLPADITAVRRSVRKPVLAVPAAVEEAAVLPTCDAARRLTIESWSRPAAAARAGKVEVLAAAVDEAVGNTAKTAAKELTRITHVTAPAAMAPHNLPAATAVPVRTAAIQAARPAGAGS